MSGEHLLIGICGGTGSGKTTLAQALRMRLGEERCALISQDDYYHDLSHLSAEERDRRNFDHPSAIDFALLADHLERLTSGNPIDAPRYDFHTHCRAPACQSVSPKAFVIIEGILLFTDARIRDRLGLRIYLDVPADVRLARRVLRDVRERGRDVASVVEQYLGVVRPMHEAFVEPWSSSADVVFQDGDGVEQMVRRLEERIRDWHNTG